MIVFIALWFIKDYEKNNKLTMSLSNYAKTHNNRKKQGVFLLKCLNTLFCVVWCQVEKPDTTRNLTLQEKDKKVNNVS